MDSQVREKRTFHFAHVIVTADAIRELAEILVKQTLPIKSSNVYFSVEVEAFDGTKYESASIEMFSKGGILDTKQVKTVQMSFAEFSQNVSIRVDVSDTADGWGENRIEVGAADSTWVNGVMRHFEHAVDGWEKQPTWPLRNALLLVFLFSLCIGRFIEFLVLSGFRLLQVTLTGIPGPSSPFALAGELVIVFALGTPFAMPLVKEFVGLWPSVEFRTGREFARKAGRRRMRIWLILGSVIIPFLVTVIGNLVTRLIN